MRRLHQTTPQLRLGDRSRLVPTLCLRQPRPTILPHICERHSADRVLVATSSMAARDVTSSWVAASQDPQTILVGTREIALWMLAGGGLWTIVEEGRRVMKSPATPTLHARDIVVRRSAASGTELHMVGPVAGRSRLFRLGYVWSVPLADPGPSLRSSTAPRRPLDRLWSLSEPRIAISGAAKAGVNVFILVAARGYAPAFRCLSCSELRRCSCLWNILVPRKPAVVAAMNLSDHAGACERAGSLPLERASEELWMRLRPLLGRRLSALLTMLALSPSVQSATLSNLARLGSELFSTSTGWQAHHTIEQERMLSGSSSGSLTTFHQVAGTGSFFKRQRRSSPL